MFHSLSAKYGLLGPSSPFPQVAYHKDSFWIDGFRDHLSIGSDELDHFVQTRPFDFLKLQVRQGICRKIKDYTTLSNFLNEQLLSLARRPRI